MSALSIEAMPEKEIRRLYELRLISLNEARAAMALPLSDHEYADNVLVCAPHGSSCWVRVPRPDGAEYGEDEDGANDE